MPGCDFTSTQNWLIAAGAGIAASAGFVASAAIANGSFFGAAASPLLMVAAGAAASGAAYALSQAIDALNQYCSCLRESGRDCQGQCSNLGNNLQAIKVVMGIDATACFATAVWAWVPWAAQPAMLAILGAMILESFLVLSAVVFLVTVLQCAQQGIGPMDAQPTATSD
jgi:hypothetical protein